MLWHYSGDRPGFPISIGKFIEKIENNPLGSSHFSLSTVKLDNEGKLRRKKENFAAFYIVVLDDIGSGAGAKINPEKIPKRLKKAITYRIETSRDNEQWGFMLDEPIFDYEVAQDFFAEIVHLSGTDGGGCSATKIVRMPCGANIKKCNINEFRQPFQCKLVYFDSAKRSTPDQLLKALSSDITFDSIKKRTHKRPLRSGTTSYKKSIYLSNINGIIDPVLEFLNKKKLLLSEGGEWHLIKCPWGDRHTDGQYFAYYSPIGWGEIKSQRAFKCFHDHCKEKKYI